MFRYEDLDEFEKKVSLKLQTYPSRSKIRVLYSYYKSHNMKRRFNPQVITFQDLKLLH